MKKVEFTQIDNFDEEGNGYPTYYEIPSDIKQAFEDKTGYIKLRKAQKYVFTKLVITKLRVIQNTTNSSFSA